MSKQINNGGSQDSKSSSYEYSKSSTSGEHEYKDWIVHQDTTKIMKKTNDTILKKSRTAQHATNEMIEKGIKNENQVNKGIRDISLRLKQSPLKPTYMKYLPHYKKTSSKTKQIVCQDELCVKTKFIKNTSTLSSIMSKLQSSGKHEYPTTLDKPIISHVLHNEIQGILLKLQFILLTLFMHNDFNLILMDQHDENVLLVKNEHMFRGEQFVFDLPAFIHKTQKLYDLCYTNKSIIKKDMIKTKNKRIQNLEDDDVNSSLTDHNPFPILNKAKFENIVVPLMNDMPYETYQPYFYKLFAYLQRISPYKMYFIDSEKMRCIKKATIEQIQRYDYDKLDDMILYPYIKNENGVVFSDIAIQLAMCEIKLDPYMKNKHKTKFDIDLEEVLIHIFPIYFLNDIQSW